MCIRESMSNLVHTATVVLHLRLFARTVFQAWMAAPCN